MPVAVLLSCETLPGHVWEPCVSVEVELRTVTTCAPAGASWVLSGVSGFRATQRDRFQAETPLRRCAELDFRFLSADFLAGMHTCYLELKLSTNAANPIARHLSCKTLLRRFRNPEFRRKRRLEDVLSWTSDSLPYFSCCYVYLLPRTQARHWCSWPCSAISKL